MQQSGTESSTDAKTEPRETTLAYTGEMDENYLDDVYFIGDSRTVGLVRAGMPEDHLFAETGMCHEDALTKRVVILDDTAYLDDPRRIADCGAEDCGCKLRHKRYWFYG